MRGEGEGRRVEEEGRGGGEGRGGEGRGGEEGGHCDRYSL